MISGNDALRRSVLYRSAGLTALAFACLTGTAHAQSAAATSPAQSTGTAIASPEATAESADQAAAADKTDVIVTAQFRQQRLQDTPIAITALSADMMAARGQTNLVDIGRNVPNVTLQPSISAYGGTAAIYIRGVGQFDRDFALEPGVGVYIDDVYYPTLYGAQLDLLDLDRVEILRGPQGTLAGKNSIGGAVKLYSKKPSGDNGGYVQATVGSYRRHEIRASVDFALSDTLSARIAGVYKKSDGYITRIDFKCRNPSSLAPSVATNVNCKIGTEGGQDFKGLRGSLRWAPNSNLEVNLSGDVYSDDSEPSPSRIVAVRPTSPSVALLTPFLNVGKYESYSTYQSQRGYGYNGKNQLDGYGASGQIDYKLGGDFSLTSVTAYREYTGFFQVDLDGTSYGGTTQQIGLKFRQITQELRLNGSVGDGLLDFTVGGFYYDGDGVSSGRVEINPSVVNPPAAPPTASTYTLMEDSVDSSSKSAFVHAILHPAEGLSITGGLRYTSESKLLVLHRKDPITFLNQPLDGATGRYKGDNVDYRVSVDYRWSPEFLTYASFSTGYKGGGVSSRPFRIEQVVPFNPEKLDAYEVGFKADLFDRVVRFNASAFYNKYDNIQLTVRGGTGIFTPPASVTVNAGKADVKGAEGELTLRPTHEFTMDASLGYLDFQYKSLLPGVLSSGLTLSNVTPFTPTWKWSAGAQYDFAIGANSTITPRFDVSYQSHVYANPVNNPLFVVPPYTVSNARLSYKDKSSGIEATLAVTNVFNKYYYSSLYDNLYASGGTTIANVARPREWSLSLKAKF